MYHVPLALQFIYGCIEKGKNRDGEEKLRFQEEGREWRLPGLLYADDLALYGDLEEDLEAKMGRLADVCRRTGKRSMQVRARWWC